VNKCIKSVRRRPATDLSRTIAGHEDNATTILLLLLPTGCQLGDRVISHRDITAGLQDKVGVPAEVQQDIVGRVFGAEGLAGGRFQTTLDASGRFPDSSGRFL